MSLQARKDVWAILADIDEGQRTSKVGAWRSFRDVCAAHPQWRSGLIQLADWGYPIEVDTDKRLVRIAPTAPSFANAFASRLAVAKVQDLPELPEPGSDTFDFGGSDDAEEGSAFGEHNVSGRISDSPRPSPVPRRSNRHPVERRADNETVHGVHAPVQGDSQAVRAADSDSPEEPTVVTTPERERTPSPDSSGVQESDGLEEFSDENPEDAEVVGDLQGPGSIPEVEIRQREAAEDLAQLRQERRRYALNLGSIVLDENFVTSTNGILAVKGSGKSYTAMVIAEEMLEAELPFSVLDPTGAWWGLSSGATGNPTQGYPLLIAGGDHGHVDLHAGDGIAVAEWLVREYPTQLLCDLSLMTPGQQHHFAHAFASTLFHRNRRAMHVFVDECDEFMPQRPQDKVENLCLAAFDRLVRRGRIRGIGLTGITQRSAVWSKNVLSQVGALLVLKTASPQDMKAIESWVSKHLSADNVAKFLTSLGKLQLGRGYYVSPGRNPLVENITIRKRRTYDSSRTPEVGETVNDPAMRQVDGTRLASWLSERRADQAPSEDDDGDDAPWTGLGEADA